jgi:hypothetical protein
VAPPSPAVLAFAATGATLGGGFRGFWERNGGLAIFGYPISDEFVERSPVDGQSYTVQYFEHARFEYHPEAAGTAYEVQLGLLGRQLTATRAGEGPFQPLAAHEVADETRRAFVESGHTLGGVFQARWEATGGVAIYGLPISEPFEEEIAPGAPPVLVQYFERARMEYRPEFAGTVDEVRLSPLGTMTVAALPARR